MLLLAFVLLFNGKG